MGRENVDWCWKGSAHDAWLSDSTNIGTISYLIVIYEYGCHCGAKTVMVTLRIGEMIQRTSSQQCRNDKVDPRRTVIVIITWHFLHQRPS